MAGHHHQQPEAGDRKVLWAVAVNVLLTLAQIVGGIVSGSLALIADALHNLSDAISLVIAFAARRIARRPSDAAMTFGYVRAEVVAALVNYTTLIVIGLYLLYEAGARALSPEPIAGWIVVIVAGIALAVDLVTAALTYALSKESMNIRAAFLHNLADALGSVGVIVAGTLILLYDWRLADPIVTALIALYILWHAFAEIGGAIRLLMLGTPPETDVAAVVKAIRADAGVEDVHHLHLWQIDEAVTALEAHIVVRDTTGLDEAQAVRQRLKVMLGERFGIAHSTLEVEDVASGCGDGPELIGHPVGHAR